MASRRTNFWAALVLLESGGAAMRQLVVGLAIMLVSLGWGTCGFGQEVPSPRGELRIVDKSPVNWISMTFNVFEHLMEADVGGELVPRLATGWRWLTDRTLEVTLRRGVIFHNGEVFDAEVVKLNWDEQSQLQQPHTVGPALNFKPGSRLEIIDPYTVRFVFPETDGGALAKSSMMHLANRQFYRDVGWGTEHW
jgi:ABC-type transport system substrate-binding protein